MKKILVAGLVLVGIAAAFVAGRFTAPKPEKIISGERYSLVVMSDGSEIEFDGFTSNKEVVKAR